MFSRRDFIKTTGAGMIHLVAGQVVFGSSVSAQVRTGFTGSAAERSLLELPVFDGVFSVDPQTLNLFARDFGLNVSYKPAGVLKPGSVRDLQKIVIYCHKRNLKLSIKGFGGAAYGQTQILNGIVVDTQTMKKISWVDGQTVSLQPGLIWKEVLDFTITRKLAPPIMPDTIVTTVGGTVCAGGIGETSYRLGGVVDHIVELTVVLMNGEVRRCSPKEFPQIFYGVLAGMGQVAIISEVKLRLMPAPDLVFTIPITYNAGDKTYLNDSKLVSMSEPYGAIGGHVIKAADGSLQYQLDVTFWSSQNPKWMNAIGGTKGQIKKWSYFEYSNRNTQGWIDAVKNGALNLPRPYLSFYIPEASVSSMLDFILKDPNGRLGAGRVYLAPLLRSSFKTPLFSLPKSGLVYHVRFYRVVKTPPGGPEHRQMLNLNQNILLPLIYKLGGTVYLPFSPLLTKQQLALQYPQDVLNYFGKLKLQLDPSKILNKGAGLF